MIETTITHAWQTQAKWLYLLSPLAWLYGAVSSVRRFLYKQGILSSYRADVPVMVIGNITVGGSGKTPLIISLVKYLQTQGIEVGVISRGYGGDSKQMPAIVTLDSLPHQVGDEPCLIVQSTVHNGHPVAMAVCPNRQQAIELLLQHNPNIQLIISDDGLQHYKLQRDIEWIVVDSHRGFGNQQLLPVGFLREPMSRLDGATVVYHQLDSDNQPSHNRLTMSLQADKLQAFQQTNIAMPQKGDTVYAVSGIGYPKRFFDTLKTIGYQVIEHPYPDHYDFSLQDLIEIAEKSGNFSVIITSKDAVKISYLIKEKFADMEKYGQVMPLLDALVERLFVLPVTAKLSEDCIIELQKSLNKLTIKPI